LDSGTTDLFIDTKFTKEKRFKLKRLKNPLLVWNIRRAITYQIECNMFFKGHVERVRMNVYNLGKTKIILDMP